MINANAIEPTIRPRNLKPQSEGRDLVSLGGDRKKAGVKHALAGEAEGVVEVEDVQPVRGLPTPILPPRAEIEAHRIDHRPPRGAMNALKGLGVRELMRQLVQNMRW